MNSKIPSFFVRAIPVAFYLCSNISLIGAAELTSSIKEQEATSAPATQEASNKFHRSPRLEEIHHHIKTMEKLLKTGGQVDAYLQPGDPLTAIKSILQCPKCVKNDGASHKPEDIHWYANLYYHDLLRQTLAKLENDEKNKAKDSSGSLSSSETNSNSGYSGAIVEEFHGQDGIPPQIIKIFREEEKGLKELLCSLIAFRLHPRQELRIVDIYDAVLCQNALSFIMEKARGKDIHSFIATADRENVIRACARYLAMFHIRQSQRYDQGEGIQDKFGVKYLNHAAGFFHRFNENPIEGERKGIKLFRLYVNQMRDESHYLDSSTIFQALSGPEQEDSIRYVESIQKAFAQYSGEIYRALKGKDQGEGARKYWTTITHGDAHRRNFFYDDDTTKRETARDSLDRVTMIDYSSIVDTYGSIGDPAEDVGRFLGSLWDWASENFENHPSKNDKELLSDEELLKLTEEEKQKNYKLMSNLRDIFMDFYIDAIKKEYPDLIIDKFKEIFDKNCDFYQLRYYRAIFNSKETRKKDESKKILLGYWLQERKDSKTSIDQDLEKTKEKERTYDIPYYLPEARVPSFIESSSKDGSYLTQLHDKLQNVGRATLTSQVSKDVSEQSPSASSNQPSKNSQTVLTGMGGVGKSSLALEYAYQSLERGDYALIWWLPSENPELSLKNRYKEILHRINPKLVEGDFSNTDEIKDWKERIEKNIPPEHKWLLIYDNARNPESLKEMIPNHPNIHLLITSRFQGWNESSRLNLDAFNPKDSIRYLLTVTGLNEKDEQARRAAERVAEALQNLPLALSQAANYIKLIGGESINETLFDEYLEDPTVNIDPLKDKYPYDILIGKTYSMMEKEINQHARNIMVWCSYLDPVLISEDIFPTEEDKAALTQLYASSLIKKVKDHHFSIHRFVQGVIRDKQTQNDLFLSIVSKFEKLFNDNIGNAEKNDKLSTSLPHILTFLEHSDRLNLDRKYTHSLRWIGRVLYLIEMSNLWDIHANRVVEKKTASASPILSYENRVPEEERCFKKIIFEIKESDNLTNWLASQKPFPIVQNALGLMHITGCYGKKDCHQGVEWFKKASISDYTPAMYNIGIFYHMIEDYAEAQKHFFNAANKEHIFSMTIMGSLYQKGQGVDKDYTEAMKWYRKAADKGDAIAMRNIGTLYQNGQGVDKEYTEAMKWYRGAADKGDAIAMHNIGTLYQKGQGVDEDYTEAMKWYRKAADKGNAIAMRNIGTLYQNGQGVDKDYTEAMKWYRGAANKGDAKAMYNIGCLYHHGRGVHKDYTETRKWYLEAANNGNSDAMNNIGSLYQNGEGVDKDYTEAMKWYRGAADTGDAEAMYNIGCLYHYGQGVDKNDTEAMKWYRGAADKGDRDAMNNIGVLYHKGGHGIPINYDNAMEWYRKAADKGDAVAMYHIGLLYERKSGKKNKKEAKFWYDKAKEAGYKG